MENPAYLAYMTNILNLVLSYACSYYRRLSCNLRRVVKEEEQEEQEEEEKRKPEMEGSTANSF